MARPRSRLCSALISVLAALVTTPAVAQSDMFRGNAAHAGVYPGPAPKAAPRLKWAFHTRGYLLGSPAIVGDAVYIGSGDGNLYRVTREAGLERWRFKTGARIASSPAVAHDVVYFASYDGFFYAVDAASGKLHWKFQTKGERRFAGKNLHGSVPAGETMPDPWDVYLSSPVVSKNLVYFGSGDGNVYALNAATGRLQWTFSTGNVVHASPAIADGVLYVGSWDSYFYALDAATGAVRWRFKTGEDHAISNQQGIQSSAAVAAGVVYFGCRDAHLYAVDAGTGRLRWSYDAKGSWVITSPAVRNGKVYFGTSDTRQFVQVDARTGTVDFTLQLGGYLFASPAIVANRAYSATWDGKLTAIDLDTRKAAWVFQSDSSKANLRKFQSPDGSLNFMAAVTQQDGFYDDVIVAISKLYSVGSFLSSPVVSGGVLYIGGMDGTLYALN